MVAIASVGGCGCGIPVMMLEAVEFGGGGICEGFRGNGRGGIKE